MFEAFQAWREVAHVSEWTGLSAGALVLLGAGAYALPELRSIAIRAAIVVGVGYAALVYGNHTGRADVKAEWDAANARAAAQAAAADAESQKALDAKYQPVIGDLQQQLADRNAQVNDYESKMVGGIAGGSCQLGAGALRLRPNRLRK